MEYLDIKTEMTGGIGILTLSRPDRRNAISIRMRREISDCLNKWAKAPEIGLVIFTGAGEAFSSGFELSEFADPDSFGELYDTSCRYHRDVWHFPKPTIAAINGPAMGGGFDLAVLCDIRICSESAVFGHPEIKFGAPPIFTPLKWIVGDGAARDLCLTGRKIDSGAAYRLGLTSEVMEGSGLLPQAIRLGQEILKAPADTIKYAKECFTRNAGFEESFQIEHDKAFRDILLPKARNGFK